MNQPSQKNLFLISFLIGTLGSIYYTTSTLALHEWLYSLYPVDSTNHHLFYLILNGVALLAGMAINIKTLKDIKWTDGLWVFLLFNFIVFISFIFLSEKENDDRAIIIAEFLTVWVYYLIGLGCYIRFVAQLEMRITSRLISVLLGLLSGGLVYTIFSLLSFIRIFELWIIALVLVGLLIHFSRRFSS